MTTSMAQRRALDLVRTAATQPTAATTAARKPAGRRAPTALRRILAPAIVVLAAGCSANELPFVDLPDLPETPGVGDKPWPRLADAPPPESADALTTDNAKGAAIETGLAADADAVKAADAEMRAEPVTTTDLAAEAAAVRAAARAQ